MKKSYTLSGTAIALALFWGVTAQAQIGAGLPSRLNIPFVVNAGQIADSNIAFCARTFAGPALVMRDGSIRYDLPGGGLREFAAGVSRTRPEGLDPATAQVHSFVGAPERWRCNLPAFEQVGLGEIWPGVTMSLRAHPHNIEKRFTIAPGAAPGAIRMTVPDAIALGVADNGELVVETGRGAIRFSAPIAWQEHDGRREPVTVSYRTDGHQYGFAVGAYDCARALIIDPMLAATRFGNSSNDTCGELAIDAAGNVFVAGTLSAYQPSASGYDTTADAAHDAFVAKMDANLNLLAFTFLGGKSNDYGSALALDAAGQVFIAGYTHSSDFPTTPGAYDRSINGRHDVFVSKLDNTLSQLLASTFIGGKYSEYPYAMAIDSSGRPTVVGMAGADAPHWSLKSNYPTTPGAYQPNFDNYVDGFLSRFNADLTTLEASTFFGKSSYEYCTDVLVDSAGNTYVTLTGWLGGPSAISFPPGGYDLTPNGGLEDGVVAKFNSNFSAILAGTYLGGTNEDDVMTMCFDKQGNIVVGGYTASSNFPAVAGCLNNPTGCAFLVKLTPSLSSLRATARPGGYQINDVIAEPNGSLLCCGTATAANSIPTPANAFDNRVFSSGKDAFIARINSNMTALTACTLLGGKDYDTALALAVNTSGAVYVAGETASPDFPGFAPGGVGPGTNDIFIVKFDSDLTGNGVPSLYYVNAASANPVPPFADWATAATSIEQAIYYANSSSIVFVADGIYRPGNPVNLNYPVEVRSANGPANAIIDGQNRARCVMLYDPDAKLMGFTLRNGFDPYSGAGAIVFLGGTIENCIVRDCIAHWGAGVYFASNGILRNCLVFGNSVTGEYDSGGGVYAHQGTVIDNCTIADNRADSGVGGLAAAGGPITIRNTIIYNNTSSNATRSNYYISASSTTALWFNCCAAPLPAGTLCIAGYPGFIDRTVGNYRLAAGSPCIDAGQNAYAGGATDLDGNPRIAGAAVDLGAYEYVQQSASVVYPVTMSDRNAHLYVWDNTAGSWIISSVLANPTQITVPNVQVGRYYWVGIWDYAASAYALGEWIGRFSTPVHGRFVGHIASLPPSARVGLPDDWIAITASSGHTVKPTIVNMTTGIWDDTRPAFASNGLYLFEPDAWSTWYWIVFYDYNTGSFF